MDDKEKKGGRIRRAAALSYDPGKDQVPVLSAYGEGYVAERIVEKALEAGVPVQRDPNLAGMLARMSVGDEIPQQLYEVVARVLIFVSEVDRSYGSKIRDAAK